MIEGYDYQDHISWGIGSSAVTVMWYLFSNRRLMHTMMCTPLCPDTICNCALSRPPRSEQCTVLHHSVYTMLYSASVLVRLYTCDCAHVRLYVWLCAPALYCPLSVDCCLFAHPCACMICHCVMMHMPHAFMYYLQWIFEPTFEPTLSRLLSLTNPAVSTWKHCTQNT